MGVIADTTLYLNEDKTKVLEASFEEDERGIEREIVPEGAAFLLARRGTVVTDEDARKYNVQGDPEETTMSARSRIEQMESQLKVALTGNRMGEASVLRQEIEVAKMAEEANVQSQDPANEPPKAARTRRTAPESGSSGEGQQPAVAQ